MREIRLLPREKKIIIDSAIECFNEHTSVYLFGSKTDINKKGGDIDILVLTDDLPDRKKIRLFKILLLDKLGERKIDVVSATKNSVDNFVNLIKEEGICLWEY